MVDDVHTGYLRRMFLPFRRELPIQCASAEQTGDILRKTSAVV